MEQTSLKPNKKNIVIVLSLLVVVLGIAGIMAYGLIKNNQPDENKIDQTTQNDNKKDDESEINDETGSKETINVYFIDLENQRGVSKTIGCGDSVIAQPVELANPNRETKDLVAAVLSLLFEPKDQYVGKGGLYNSLYQSNIVVDKVEISKNKASVYLTGTMLSGGTCDDPRIMAQLTQTVLQFEDIKEVTFFVNNKEYTGSQKE